MVYLKRNGLAVIIAIIMFVCAMAYVLLNQKYLTIPLKFVSGSFNQIDRSMVSDLDGNDKSKAMINDTSKAIINDKVSNNEVSNKLTSKVIYDKDTWDVEWGDTLSDISRQTGVSVQEIANINEIQNPNLIYAGSSLKIKRPQ